MPKADILRLRVAHVSFDGNHLEVNRSDHDEPVLRARVEIAPNTPGKTADEWFYKAPWCIWICTRGYYRARNWRTMLMWSGLDSRKNTSEPVENIRRNHVWRYCAREKLKPPSIFHQPQIGQSGPKNYKNCLEKNFQNGKRTKPSLLQRDKWPLENYCL